MHPCILGSDLKMFKISWGSFCMKSTADIEIDMKLTSELLPLLQGKFNHPINLIAKHFCDIPLHIVGQTIGTEMPV